MRREAFSANMRFSTARDQEATRCILSCIIRDLAVHRAGDRESPMARLAALEHMFMNSVIVSARRMLA